MRLLRLAKTGAATTIPEFMRDVNRKDRLIMVTDAEYASIPTTGVLADEIIDLGPVYQRELSAAINVSVPAISGTAVLPADSAVTDVSTAFTLQPAVGDKVTAIPQEALESDCLLCGAYVVGTDSIEVVFAAKEGGDGVTNANKSFKFLLEKIV